MEFLLSLDHALFSSVNHVPHTALTDGIAQFLSWVGGTGIIWLIILFILFVREERKDHWFFLPFSIAGVISWIVSATILKPFFARARPIDLEGTILVDPSINGFSFPSSHAAVSWALAYVLAAEEPSWRWGLFILAFLISLSRLYLGVHFPSDVLMGALLGLAIGHIATELTKYLKHLPRWR